MKNDENEINKIYKKMAHTYYESRKSGTIHNTYIANPAIRKLVGNIKGLKLLDIGCGFGEDLKYFQKRGAIVSGIELNLELISIMKNDPELKCVPFFVCPLFFKVLFILLRSRRNSMFVLQTWC